MLATFIIGIIIFAYIAFIIKKQVKKTKSGQGGCGCGCSGCSSASMCHGITKSKKQI